MENKSASLLVPLGKTLSGIPLLIVVDRWPATLKRARYGVSIAFHARLVHVELSHKTNLKVNSDLSDSCVIT